MSRIHYPFAAIAGQQQMKLALLLAAVDWRLGVLLRGDKGAGKTTIARALAALLPAPAPFVNLPVGATEDRLLGGLNLERALKGEAALKPGLLAEANGGVLYVDEVNLLPAHLGDALLDAAASGMHVIEREGFSASYPAEFVLLGSMNPEEGSLRPQLLDRFALSVDVTATLDPAERQTIVERRLAFDRSPASFCAQWAADQLQLTSCILAARERLLQVAYSSAQVRSIGEQIGERGIRSLRADLATLRAAMALAALSNEPDITEEHVRAVLPLVLAHRKPQLRAPQAPSSERPASQPQSSQPQSPDRAPSPPNAPQAPSASSKKHEGERESKAASSESPQPEPEPQQSVLERIFKPAPLQAEPLAPGLSDGAARGLSAASSLPAPGARIGSRRTDAPVELDLRVSLLASMREGGDFALTAANLYEPVRAPRSGRRYLLVIDASGSHAAQQRMRLVKGAALSMLTASFQRDDEVAIIAFRGTTAEVLLELTHDVAEAATALEYLPTGGRTPLAHALERAHTLATPGTLLILFTDGRPNVSLRGGDAGEEALQLAASFRCEALVVDTADTANQEPLTRRLADALGGRHVTLSECIASQP